jgi:hypothetical protein
MHNVFLILHFTQDQSMIKQTHKHTKSLSSSTQPLFITQSQQQQQQQQQKEGELLWLGSIVSKMTSRQREQVGDFYVHLVNNDVAAADHQEGAAGSRRRRGRQQPQLVVDKNLTSSTKLLAYNDKLPGSNGIKKPTVLHFYDGG